MRNAFEAAPGGKVLADESGSILRVNPAFCRLVGQDASALVGQDIGDVLHPDDRDAFTRACGDLLTGRTQIVHSEPQIVHADGHEVPVALVASPVKHSDGSVCEVLVNMQDISERRIAERARAELALEQAARAKAEAAFARERAIAEALQKDLLPETLPQVPGLAIAARFEAGGPETQIGGDWYDAIALPGGRLGLVVGDVAGRGVMAAARMGQLRSVARAYALEGHSPAVVAERLNHYHLGLGDDQMTTLVYAIAEPDRGLLRYVNAGHPPPLLTLPGEAPLLLDGASPPLGAADSWRFDEREVEFPVGGTLVLYTDGLIEGRSEGIDQGLLRLRSAAIGDTTDVERICERLHAAGLAPGSGADDVTTLVLRAQEQLGNPARFVLGPDREALGALRRALRRWLVEVGAEEDVEAVTMAANEAWQNAIEHGNAFSRAPIAVEFALEQQDVVITVRDTGLGGGGATDPDRGRGLELMRALMDEVTVDLGAQGAVVTLRRRAAGASASAGAAYASPSASYSRR
jgi:PAS domain S-box-containing protein